jgi:vancomycin resistance protein YoaR
MRNGVSVVASPRRRSAARRARAERAALVALVAVAAALLAVVGYRDRHQGRLCHDLVVGDVAVGDLTPEVARARVEERTRLWLAAPLQAEAAGGGWMLIPTDLGLQLDPARALDDGRDRGPFHRLLAALPGGSHRIAIPATLDDGRLEATLRAWAAGPTHPPQDASFALAPDGSLSIVPGRDGAGFDAAASRSAFIAGAGGLTTRPVRLALVTIRPEVDAPMLRAVEPAMREWLASPPEVTHLGRRWTLPLDQFVAALRFSPDESGRPIPALNAGALRRFFDEIDTAVSDPGADARIAVDAGGRFVVAPERPGTAIDRVASAAALDAALADGRRDAALVVGPRPPAVGTADLVPVRDYLEWIASTPLVVSFAGEQVRVFARADIQPLIVVTPAPGEPVKAAVTLDPIRLRALAQLLAGDLDRPVRDAEFTFADRRERALGEAILGAHGSVAPDVAVTAPRVPSSAMADIAVGDLLAHGQTDYGSSIAPRWHNVELATERLNGALIPPGAIFSFNQQVGAQTVENGYQEAYGIALVGGTGGQARVQTVNSVAGGICQVSTTLFQAAFRAGLPIEERNWHFYWVTYGTPPPGMVGLDATVDDAAGLDFKFANNSGGWLAIEAVADEGILTISLFGTDPGWDVRIDEPAISNVRPADPKPIYDNTHDLPPGETRYIEHAADGFDVALRRRVVDGAGNLVVYTAPSGQRYEMDTTFTSSYFPARDRYQVGVPPDVPEGETEERP